MDLSFRDELENEMDKILTEDDIKLAMKGKVKIISYSELKGYNSLDDVLKPWDAVVILFAITNPNSGHWTCIHRKKNGDVIFTDSYGLLPMDENHYIPYSIVKYVSDQFKPYIYKLFIDYHEGKVRYSQYRLQGKDTNVCGRYCILRLRFPELSENEFAKLLKYGTTVEKWITPDILVTMLTSPI